MTDEQQEKPESARNSPTGKWLWLVLGLILLVMLFAILKSGGNPAPEKMILPRVAGRVQRGDLSGAGLPPDSESVASSGSVVSGTITISDALKSKVKPGSVIYVIARPAGVKKGPTVAALRVDSTDFPIQYAMSEKNLMVTGAALEGKLDISVRLDQDGDAGTRQKGDLSGSCKKNPVSVGATDADIVLDTEITEEHLPEGHPGVTS